jgi:hypothetical protein
LPAAMPKNHGFTPDSPRMKIADARPRITTALERMNVLYRQVVFDEWVVVSFQAEGGGILAYHGPRAEQFRQEFAKDVQPLRAEMEGRHLAVGDFAFATAAAGTRYDACIRIGAAAFLICNHTGKSMTEIRQDPRWLEAQKAFVGLSAQFRADPLD